MELTVDVVREWLKANAAQDGVKAFLKELGTAPLTAETVGPWLATDDGRRLVEPIIDRERTRAVKTHDEKTREANEAAVKKALDEAIAKANPKETPEQKEIREMRAEMAKQKAETERKERQLALSEKAQKAGVTALLPKGYLPEDMSELDAELARIRKAIDEMATATVNERLAGGHKPGSGNGKTAGDGADLKSMTLAQAERLEIEGKLNDMISTV